MRTVIKNVRVFGELTDITVCDGKITDVGFSADSGIDMKGLKVYPGLIDIHSHGAVGIDVTDGSYNYREVAEYELKNGITTWYPTTCTVTDEEVRLATGAEVAFENGANIVGFHLEGPFLNVKRKGGQNGELMRDPELELVNGNDAVKLVTIAPEREGSIEFIKNSKAVVCFGHTEADYEIAMEGFRAGAKCVTHIFNAMAGIHHRNPSVIGAAQDSDAYVQLISDGFHVHPSVVRMTAKLFGEDRVILISDSMAATGLCDGHYTVGGLDVYVNEGKALMADGTICGSTANLFDCVKRAVSFGINEESAFKMASENPARLMELNKGKIEVGYDADLIFVDDSLELKGVMVRGEMH